MRSTASAGLLETRGELPRSRLDTFYESAYSEIVRHEPTAAHEAEKVPRFAHLVAADKNVDERVERDIRWL